MKKWNLRKKFWRWFVYKILKHRSYKKLSRPLIILKCMLFPIKAIRWTAKEGPQLATDTWIIEGVEYSSRIFEHIAFGNDNLFRITKREDKQAYFEDWHHDVVELVKDLRDHLPDVMYEQDDVITIRQRTNEFLAKLEKQ